MQVAYSNVHFCAALLVLFGGLAVRSIGAAEVLDQAFLGEDGDFGIGDVAAQTFTAGESGLLSRVELRLGGTGRPDGNFNVYVRSAETGFPMGNNLGALTVPRSTLPFPIRPNAYVSLDMSSQGIHVTAGDRLAIIVDIRDTPGVEWGLGRTVQAGGNAVGGYSGGLASVANSQSGWAVLPFNPSLPDTIGLDFNFRTFVQPIPEPTTVASCFILCLTMAAVRGKPLGDTYLPR